MRLEPSSVEDGSFLCPTSLRQGGRCALDAQHLHPLLDDDQLFANGSFLEPECGIFALHSCPLATDAEPCPVMLYRIHALILLYE